MDGASTDIVIVGGSLAGLTLALACAARGVPVRILERAAQARQGGDSLSIDLADLFAATGRDPRDPPALPVVHAYRDRVLTTWPALHAWLQDRVAAEAGIALEQEKAVIAVVNRGDRARLTLDDGTERVAAVVIGADGYRSVVRQAVAPHSPLARYAGYVVWRGLVDEQVLQRPVPWPSNGGLWIDYAGGYRLVAAVLPGRNGSLEAGRRQVTFAWFDVHREALLRQIGCLNADGHVVRTLGRGWIDKGVRSDLVALIPRLWPHTWAEAVEVGVRSHTALSCAPIAEYKPDRLASGALTIVGDAAHVVSPMTGRGFASGVEDAAVLAQRLAERPKSESVPAALARYEAARLPLVRSLVAQSMRISGEFVRYAREASVPARP
jgi:2-polyprenyl-6-methoxyphenol hydroxylase-like FAD-dependent oxidoreductase